MSNFYYEYTSEGVLRTELVDNEKLPIKGRKLSSLLNENHSFTEEDIFFITEQLLDILDEMRSVFPPVLHKNINPENIIIKDGMKTGLINFNSLNKENSIYIAPEGLNYPTPKSDLYSLGVVLISVLLNGDVSKLKKENNKLVFKEFIDFNEDFKKFLVFMVDFNIDNRFRDTKIAKSILRKIKNKSISPSDWPSKNRNSKSDDSALNYEDRLHNEFEENLKNLDVVKVGAGRHRLRGTRGVRTDPALTIKMLIFAGIIITIIVMFVSGHRS